LGYIFVKLKWKSMPALDTPKIPDPLLQTSAPMTVILNTKNARCRPIFELENHFDRELETD